MDYLRRLREECEACDLKSYSSPYLPKTFSLWRRKAFQGASEQFIRLVDETLLPEFLTKVKACYLDAIISSDVYSEKLGLPKDSLLSSSEFHCLAAVMSQWSVEIELATDIIDRAQLYRFYEVPKSLSSSFAALQQEWGTSQEPNLRQMYRFLLHSAAYAADRAATMIRTHVTGVVAGNITQSRNIIIAGTLYAYLCGSVPWAVLAILGTQTAWVVSGWLIVRLGRGVGQSLDEKQLNMHLAALRGQFTSLSGQLTELNERGKTRIMACATASTEDERQTAISELRLSMEGFLQKRLAAERQQTNFDEDEIAASCLSFSEVGDWLIIDKDDPEVTQLTKSLFTVDS